MGLGGGVWKGDFLGWVKARLCTVIFAFREDRSGEYYHLVTLWRSTQEEKQLYEANA